MWNWRRIEDEFYSHSIVVAWRSYFYVLWFDWDSWGLNDIYVMDYWTGLEIQEHVELEKDWRWIPLSQHWICGEELFLSIMIWLRWMKIEWYWCDGLYNQIGDSGACGIGEVLKMNSILELLDLGGRVIFMYFDLIEMNDDWMIFMWWIMEPDWRFRSMWDWRRIEDEFYSQNIVVG